MKDIKFFEIRDRGTCISAMAINCATIPQNNTPLANIFLRNAGYCANTTILLIYLSKPQCSFDPHEWGKNPARTMPVAHDFIIKNWDTLSSGDLIDVQVILKEKETPAKTEILCAIHKDYITHCDNHKINLSFECYFCQEEEMLKGEPEKC